MLNRQAVEHRNLQNYLAAKAAFNADDIEGCMAFYAIDHQIRSQQTDKGRHHIERFLTSLKNDWPDVRVEVERTVVQEDWLAAWCTTIATHQKQVWGVDPTGKKITTTFWEMHRFDGSGKIAETWNLIDAARILQQLGILPSTQ